jgi:hypothetical protein
MSYIQDLERFVEPQERIARALEQIVEQLIKLNDKANEVSSGGYLDVRRGG